MKSIFNKALFKEQLRKFWLLDILFFFMYFLFIIIIPKFIQTNNIKIFYMQNDFIMFIFLYFSPAIVAIFFSHLFNPKESITINTYPVNKTGLWLTNVLAGFTLIIVPLLILFVFNLTKRFELPFLEDQNYIFFICVYFLKLILIAMFIYSFYLVLAHISGHPCMYGLLIFFSPCLLAILFRNVIKIANNYSSSIIIFDEILESVPEYIEINHYNYISKSDNLKYFIILFFVAIVLLGMSFFLNRIRKQEYIGDMLVFKSLKNIIIILVCVCGVFLGANIFESLYSKKLFMYIGMVVGFLITYYSSYMSIMKSFNVFKKATKDMYKFCLCTILFSLIILVSTKFVIYNLEKYVPDSSDIESFSLTSDSSHRYYIKDKNSINKMVLAHKNIINANVLPVEYGIGERYYISYKLKNGKTIERLYTLKDEVAKETSIYDLFYSKEVILSYFYYLDDPKSIEYIVLDIENIDNLFIRDPKEIENLVLELKEDIFIYESDLTNRYDSWLYFQISLGSTYKSFYLKFNENSMEWLKENGYAYLFN